MSTNPSPPKLKFNRFDALVALAVVLLAAASALLFYLPKAQAGQLTVVISVGGQEYARIPLAQLPDAPTRIDGCNGYTLWLSPSHNDLIGSDGIGVCVSESDCPGQDCVHTGVITRAGQSIVCLPEQVVVQLSGGGSGPDAVLG